MPRSRDRSALHGTPDRYYMAVSLTPDGKYDGANGWHLGDPCTACAPYATDPYNQTTVPCTNPRGHAWAQLVMWRRTNPTSRYRVLAPRAETWDQAQERAAAMCERIRVHGHLLTDPSPH